MVNTGNLVGISLISQYSECLSVLNSCKDLIPGRNNVEEIPEINGYFGGINRSSLLYPYDTITSFEIYNYVVIDRFMPLSLVRLRTFRLSTWVRRNIEAGWRCHSDVIIVLDEPR